MTFLSLINNVERIVGLPNTSVSVNASTDENTRRLVALANEEGLHLARRHAWQALVTEHTFTGTAADVQVGAIPSDVDRYLHVSFYNRTKRRRLVGPMDAEEWQYQKALTAAVITDAFRIRGNSFLITPTPSTGDTYAYEYVTENWCQSAGGTGQTEWSADDDIGVVDEKLMQLGIVWRWLQINGFDYAERYNEYEREVSQAIMRDGSRRVLNFANDIGLYDNARYPVVPEGSWSL